MVVQPRARAGFIISDGAVTHPDGWLMESKPKIIYGNGRFPWAMGVSGNVMPETLLTTIGEANPLTFKQLIKRLPGAITRAIAMTVQRTGLVADSIAVGVVGVAWNFTRNRPEGFVMQSATGLLHAEMEAMVWYETDFIMANIEAGGTTAEQLGQDIDWMDPGSFDPEVDGLALITKQRMAGGATTTPGCDPSARYRIGGQVDLTEVTKAGVRIWHIHDFNDPIGLPIDPARRAVNEPE